MALSVTIVGIEYPADNRVLVNWSDGSQSEYATRAALISTVADVATNIEWAKTALLKAWIYRSPTAQDPTWAVNKTLQFDLSLNLGPLQIGEV